MSRPVGPWAYTEFFYKGMEKVWSNTFWWTLSGAFIPYAGSNPADDFVAAWGTVIRPMMPSVCTLIGCRATINDGTEVVGYEKYTTLAGTNASTDPLPEDVAAVVQRISAEPGKSGRGRVFLSGLAQSMAQGSYWTAAGMLLLDAVSVFMEHDISDSTGNVWRPATYDRLDNVLNFINQANAVALIATARRRRSRF